MKAKTIGLGMLVFLSIWLTSPNLRAEGQSEIIRNFRLPTEIANRAPWKKMYLEVRKNLEESEKSGMRNYYPGRFLFKTENYPVIHFMTFDERVPMAQALNYIMSYPGVEYAQPDYIYEAVPIRAKPWSGGPDKKKYSLMEAAENSSIPNDPFYGHQPHLRYLGMDKIYERYGFGLGEGAHIHIVDTGGGCDHPDVNSDNLMLGKDYVDGDDDPCSSPDGVNPHGTFILATMAAKTNNGRGGAGIIPNARFHVWRVLDKDGRGFSSTVDAALFQIVIESQGIGNEIVNLSLGSSQNDPLQGLAIAFGALKNITFVAASGNGGKRGMDFPAAYPQVLAVGATTFPDQNGEKTRADYSSYGPELALTAVVGDFRDRDQDGQPDGILVEAWYEKPGEYGIYIYDGTSGATPLTSATAGLLISLGARGPDQIRKILTETADDISPYGFDEETGWGSVRADVALSSIDSSLPVFGFFTQSSYVCTVQTDQDACEATVYYKVKTNRWTVYLYDNYGQGTLRELGNSVTEGSEKIKVGAKGITGVELIYYPPSGLRPGSKPKVFATTQVFAKFPE